MGAHVAAHAATIPAVKLVLINGLLLPVLARPSAVRLFLCKRTRYHTSNYSLLLLAFIMKPDSALKPRKQPQQMRARQMDADILEAAARVLEEDGVAGFNTNRVAERAGISVGSLYQYYPNKVAILFRLHELESSDTGAQVAELLRDSSRPPRERIRRAVRFFFESEADEALLREALSCSQGYFRHTVEFSDVESNAISTIASFLKEVLPGSTPSSRARDARFMLTVLSGVSEYITVGGVTGKALRVWADRCTNMLCDYLRIPN